MNKLLISFFFFFIFTGCSDQPRGFLLFEEMSETERNFVKDNILNSTIRGSVNPKNESILAYIDNFSSDEKRRNTSVAILTNERVIYYEKDIFNYGFFYKDIDNIYKDLYENEQNLILYVEKFNCDHFSMGFIPKEEGYLFLDLLLKKTGKRFARPVIPLNNNIHVPYISYSKLCDKTAK